MSSTTLTAINIFDPDEVFAHLKKELDWGGSYERLPSMLEWAGFCDSGDWLQELGEQWTGFDNVGVHADELAEAVFMHHEGGYPVGPMMDAKELAAYHDLPEILTIYRGCYGINKWGLCWSLDRSVAESFPFCLRYGGEGRPLLVKATLHKSKVAALKLGRGEAEIVTFERPKCISISTARKPAPQAMEATA